MAAADSEHSASPEQESGKTASGTGAGGSSPIVTEILDKELLSESEPQAQIKRPLVLDLILVCGVVLAVGAVTVSFLKLYMADTAKQYIAHKKYEQAISMLKESPILAFFPNFGDDPKELLSEALYLDGIKKVNEQNDVDGGLKELGRIRPGSAYFVPAQDIIYKESKPSQRILLGGTSTSAPAAPPSASEKVENMLYRAQSNP